jgi:hypothetical protein
MASAAADGGRTAIYMVIQADSEANINQSKGDNWWQSTQSHTDAFAQAFKSYDDVYLCFTGYVTVRGNQTFCGLARMRNLPHRSLRAPFLVRNPKTEVTKTYKDADTMDKEVAYIVAKALMRTLVIDNDTPQHILDAKAHLPRDPNAITDYFSRSG